MKGKTTKRPVRRRKLATALILGAMGAVAAEPALAQDLQQISDERIEFDIAAQPLSSALSEFARQARVNALYFSDDLHGLSSPALNGSYTRQQALDLLLARSGYNGRISGSSLVLVQEQSSRPQRESAASGADPDPQEVTTSEPNDEESIVITGTRIRGAAPAGANVITLDRETIDLTGRSTVQDVIQTLPQNFPGSQNEATQEGTLNARSNFTFASTVDLRGLGADATLTLVNGRRLAPAGSGNFVDISLIPLSAVERIEVLADGASATYGSDAVGGVVNIILDRNVDAGRSSLRAGGATQGGAEDYGLSHVQGLHWGGGHLSAGYEFRRRGDVDIMDRDFTRTADFRSWGGANFNRTNSNPGNITRIGATTVNLAIPHGQDGTALSESQLVSGAPNFGEINQGAWLLPRQDSHALFFSVEQDLAGFELFADAVAGYRETYAERENLPANLVVPETNAYRVLNNLFPGQGPLTIAYHMTADLGPVTTDTEVFAYSGVLGAARSFSNGWRAEASLVAAQSRERIEVGSFYDSSRIAPALASSNLATAFNPFGDGSHTNPEVLAGLTFRQTARTDGQTFVYGVRADGPLWRIGGRDIRAAFGLERREEEFEYYRVEHRAAGDSPAPTQAPGSRTVDAIFVELSLPLIRPEHDVAFARSLLVSLSARREDASDYGAETTPKVGVSWEVIEGLSFRGTWGLSFKGPQFQQLLGGTGLSYVTATAAQDPLADNGSTGVLAIAGSNPQLEPERAESWTAGIELAPGIAPSLRISATYFDIDFADRIATPLSTVNILRNPAGFESIVYRDPSPELIASYLALGTPSGTLPADGIEVIVDRRFANLSTQRVRGVDFAASYALETEAGELSFNVSASLLLEHAFVLAPGAVPVDAIDTLNGPVDWRARIGVVWSTGPWITGLSANYIDNYIDNVSLPMRPVDEYVTFDLRIARDFASNDSEGPRLSLSVQNLFDEDPPFVNNPTGYAYDASNASPIGRMVALELQQRW